MHDKPGKPLRKVRTDLFDLTGKDYFVMKDYQSNYLQVALFTYTTAKPVMKNCKAMFTRHGIPVRVVSDKGPQFSSQDFKNFADKSEFVHVTQANCIFNLMA